MALSVIIGVIEEIIICNGMTITNKKELKRLYRFRKM